MYKNLICLIAGGLLFASGCTAQSAHAATSGATMETIVFVRHGEKPVGVSNGQLTCQGQNRALALPSVLLGKYGTPQYIFAAATVSNEDDQGNTYYYLRALATIEPTAVAAGLTVNLKYAKGDTSDLQSELAKSKYQNALIFIAMEHNDLDKLAAAIVKKYGGDAGAVSLWDDSDYDSIFVVTIGQAGPNVSVTFAHDYEGLDNESTSCEVLRRIPRPPFPIRP
ncbi:MAG: histidine phosphatase family protein [Gammaproteobacteria bacterium]|nr:MAG: histidine phosphatase family protein [Gammaproteobacteria bacterium]